jgi:8-oxo-dGTP diphosphatase
VAAAILNGNGEVLLARRLDHVHQGGLWEFPGGKMASGETPEQALARELEEELGIVPDDYRRLIQVPHRYPDQAVHLDVWRVQAFGGTPRGRQGQAISWVSPENLAHWAMPAANRPICTAVRLPAEYLITPEPDDPREFLLALEHSLRAGIRLVQLRARGLSLFDLRRLARQSVLLCRDYGAALLLNGEPEQALELGAAGVHLRSAQLAALSQRPLTRDHWVGASCHTPDELTRAAQLGVDFAVLSPVLSTPSHPERTPLGWRTFARWVESCPMPVYALGGVGRRQIETAWRAGAQGVAGVRALWKPS